MITLPEIRVYKPRPFKPNWWNDNDFCEYHGTKGHKTVSCYKLKNLIQDPIDQGDITVDTNKSANTNHTIFKDPFVKHDKGKASILGTQDNTTNYTKVLHDYTINAISAGDKIVFNIIVNPRDKDCAIITCRSTVTLQGIPSNTPLTAGNYNLVEQLKKTPAQISLFELLCILPNHRAILDKGLQDSVVVRDIDKNAF